VLQVLLCSEVLLRLLLLVLTTALLLAHIHLGLLPAETGEALLVVGHVDAAITGTLHGTEDSVASGGAHETNIKVGLEGAPIATFILNVVQGAVRLGFSNEVTVHLLRLEESAGKEQASGIGSGIVGEASLNTEAFELFGVGGSHGHVTLQSGVYDRCEDALVGESDYHSVLLGVILVLVVDDKSFTGVIVRLALSSASELGLVPLRVRFVLQDLNVCHYCAQWVCFGFCSI